MKRTEARFKQDVLEDSMNTRRTLRKAVAGLLKQTVANPNQGNTESTEYKDEAKKEKK